MKATVAQDRIDLQRRTSSILANSAVPSGIDTDGDPIYASSDLISATLRAICHQTAAAAGRKNKNEAYAMLVAVSHHIELLASLVTADSE